MIKKSNIILSTIAVVSLTQAAARISKCSFEHGSCVGTYSEDVNVAFVDCFDNEGVFMSREEDFYQTPLVKECNMVEFGSLNITANNSTFNFTDNALVPYCDYFELSEGYRFTEVAGSIAYLEQVVGGPRDTFFKGVANTS